MFVVYTKKDCSYCSMAKEELERLKIPFQELLVTPSSPLMEEVMKKSGNNVMTLTFPQIFDSKGKHIGGYMDLLDYTEDEGLCWPSGGVREWGEKI